VQYLKVDPYNVDLKEHQIVSLSQRLNCSFPQLVILNQQLYCLWVEFNHLSASRSMDMGMSWTPPLVVPESKVNDFKRYRYGSNQPQSNVTIQCDFLYGTHYPNIQFLGFGGDKYDEIPTSES